MTRAIPAQSSCACTTSARTRTTSQRAYKISQLIIEPVEYASFWQVESVEGGERGDAGFGSSGI